MKYTARNFDIYTEPVITLWTSEVLHLRTTLYYFNDHRGGAELSKEREMI